MKVHALKIWPEFFEAVVPGSNAARSARMIAALPWETNCICSNGTRFLNSTPGIGLISASVIFCAVASLGLNRGMCA